jgi:hypothetical protein
MLILVGLLVAVVAGWIIIGPRILPGDAAASPQLDGLWTRTPDHPLATTLAIDGDTYRLSGSLAFLGAGALHIGPAELATSADPACAGATGTYAVEVADTDRHGLLPQYRAQTLTLTLVRDECADGARAATLAGEWVLRASARRDAHGICDPPTEEAAITGHWPEPSGCRG